MFTSVHVCPVIMKVSYIAVNCSFELHLFVSIHDVIYYKPEINQQFQSAAMDRLSRSLRTNILLCACSCSMSALNTKDFYCTDTGGERLQWRKEELYCCYKSVSLLSLLNHFLFRIILMRHVYRFSVVRIEHRFGLYT